MPRPACEDVNNVSCCQVCTFPTPLIMFATFSVSGGVCQPAFDGLVVQLNYVGTGASGSACSACANGTNDCEWTGSAPLPNCQIPNLLGGWCSNPPGDVFLDLCFNCDNSDTFGCRANYLDGRIRCTANPNSAYFCGQSCNVGSCGGASTCVFPPNVFHIHYPNIMAVGLYNPPFFNFGCCDTGSCLPAISCDLTS
jgi:hypothetical protein